LVDGIIDELDVALSHQPIHQRLHMLTGDFSRSGQVRHCLRALMGETAQNAATIVGPGRLLVNVLCHAFQSMDQCRGFGEE